MAKLFKAKFAKKFDFSPNGYDMVNYAKGEEAEISERCLKVARQVEGTLDESFKVVAVKAKDDGAETDGEKAKAAPKNKAKKAAPNNK